MASPIITIADSIVTAMIAATFTETFTPVRFYTPIHTLEELDELKVTVVPKDQEIALSDRILVQKIVRMDIGIQKKLDTLLLSEIDTLMGFVDEVIAFFSTTRKFGNAVWMKTDNGPIYAPEHLLGERVFTSVLTVTLKVVTA